MGGLVKTIKYALKKMDLLLLLLCLTATCYGIVLIASATIRPQGGDYGNVIVQSAAMVIGVALYVVFSVVDIEQIPQYVELKDKYEALKAKGEMQ